MSCGKNHLLSATGKTDVKNKISAGQLLSVVQMDIRLAIA
jgi:hypothetical protein